MRTLAHLLIFAIVALLSCTPSRQHLQKSVVTRGGGVIRVRIAAGVPRVRIAAADRIRISSGTRQIRQIQPVNGKASAVIAADAVKGSITVESWNNIIEVNGTSYRGRVEIVQVLYKLDIINIVSLEEYLAGVVPSEMMASWPKEALRSQAIASRTYALYHLKNNQIFDLDSTTNFQVYKGLSAETEPTTAAVADTAGVIAAHANRPILAFFHSTCGGHTADSSSVFSGEQLPYLIGRECPYCADSPRFSWRETITPDELSLIARRFHPGIAKVSGIAFRKKDGRVAEVIMNHGTGRITLTGREFRTLAGDARVRSLNFTATRDKSGLVLDGRGWGHGVGLCQYGARGMAQKGRSHEDILRYYYRDIRLEKISR
jgi:stage II sporulation protein D